VHVNCQTQLIVIVVVNNLQI